MEANGIKSVYDFIIREFRSHWRLIFRSALIIAAILPIGIEYQAITILSPSDFQTFQRNDFDRSDIFIKGSFIGNPSSIEANWNGGSWEKIDLSPEDGRFSGILAGQKAGQGELTVRFSDHPEVSDAQELVGIGDVFIISGQSNAVGYAINRQTYHNPILKASIFGNDYQWHELSDPTDNNFNQVDKISDDGSGPNGSYWPILATIVMAKTGFPVAFVPCAKDGSGIDDWQPAANHKDRETLYGSMISRIQAVGDARAILFHQGEHNAVGKMSEEEYNRKLDLFADSIRNDTGLPVIMPLLQDLSHANPPVDNSLINAGILEAWQDNPNILPGPDFADIIPVTDGIHFRTDQEMKLAGEMWAFAILNIYGW
jgi:hypothetical protein